MATFFILNVRSHAPPPAQITENIMLDIFLIAPPGLAHLLGSEAREAGFKVTSIESAGVTLEGGWPDVWRANLVLRGATRVLVRIAAFRAMHLAQLDKRARKVTWTDFLPSGVPIRVEATCRKSRIYHAGAAAQRVEKAAADALGCTPNPKAKTALKVRIEDDLCTISLDTSGPSLHKRGLKAQVNKAPMRETLASLFLRAAGYDGTGPVVDPMCGSGTFVLEAADMATGAAAGRNRSFAFEAFPTFDAAAFENMKAAVQPVAPQSIFKGSDRDQGAIDMSRANAERAGLSEATTFELASISDATPPEGPPGLVIANPPYGGRIGKSGGLGGLYSAFGQRMTEAFHGWRIAMVTSDVGLAHATGLNWEKPGPIVDHGGIKIRLYQTKI